MWSRNCYLLFTRLGNHSGVGYRNSYRSLLLGNAQWLQSTYRDWREGSSYNVHTYIPRREFRLEQRHHPFLNDTMIFGNNRRRVCRSLLDRASATGSCVHFSPSPLIQASRLRSRIRREMSMGSRTRNVFFFPGIGNWSLELQGKGIREFVSSLIVVELVAILPSQMLTQYCLI